eukprot:8036287-Lingulodinium_polyedra.AAC.1
MSTEGTSKGHGGPQTEEKSLVVITNVSKMSTECSTGEQNTAHTAQQSVESNDWDHAKIGATQTSTL